MVVARHGNNPQYVNYLFQVTKGFSNWKDATGAFKKHLRSNCHVEAVEAVLVLPKTTPDVGEMLSVGHKYQKEQSKNMLRLILSSVRFLARQGLALRGRGSDDSANLIQLLRLRSEDEPQLLQWLERTARKHTSAESQNEMLEIMAHGVLRNTLADIRISPFFSLMIDETTDLSNKEQLTMILRWIDEDFTVSEEFVGLHSLTRADAESIVTVIKDAFLRFELPFAKLRGQCYDGCSTMAGAKSGVAVRIEEIEPRAVFTHCFGHALNLAVGDTIKHLPDLRDCLDICFEIVKLIKFSPKRDAMLKQQKEEDGSCEPGIRTLCPTRWTVRAESLGSIIANYGCLQQLWEPALGSGAASDIKARIIGVKSQMEKFKFFFCLTLLEKLLRHTDKLSQTLQNPKLSCLEGRDIAMLTKRVLEEMRCDSNFNLFWVRVLEARHSLDVSEPELPRKRKVPARFEDGLAQPEFCSSPKNFYKCLFFEALDLVVASINCRFDQKGYRTMINIEQLLFKASNGETFEDELTSVCTFFGDDFCKETLSIELPIFRQVYLSSPVGHSPPSLQVIKEALLSLSPSQRKLVSNVSLLFQLLLILPATNASSERSFSTLRRIKSYLRSTMGQARLNHLMILYGHQERTDSLDMKAIGNTYIAKNEARKNTFAYF